MTYLECFLEDWSVLKYQKSSSYEYFDNGQTILDIISNRNFFYQMVKNYQSKILF